MNSHFIFLILLSLIAPLQGVQLGIDRLFMAEYKDLLRGKQIGLITNHTAIDAQGNGTIDLLKQHAGEYGYTLAALFAPEHGLTGSHYAATAVSDSRDPDGLPIYSLHGNSRRPTAKMLASLNLLIFDIQDLGSRSYTYSSTLFYVMEAAAKAHLPVIVLDRPNPLGGLLVDGPMLEEKWRSFVGYVNVPYCHGLTIGELARYFNAEYQVGCDLTVIPMKGWHRSMVFAETGLHWIPTSPNIPEAQTAFYYPTTGLLGELQLVNIGIGYTLPFKLIGAPWIQAHTFCQQLNRQQLPGVRFYPFHYRPFFGRFAKEDCHGALIMITDPHAYLPVTTQYAILGILKNLYPSFFRKALEASVHCEEMFNKVCGTAEMLRLLKEEKYFIWKLRAMHEKERALYLERRKRYLIADYN